VAASSETGKDLYLPERMAIGELKQSTRYSDATPQWMTWFREVSRLLRRINATGHQNGVVVTDDTGTATVSPNDMETVLYAAGDFTASSGTWTVDEADVTTFARNRLGRMLTLAFELIGTSVSATPAELRIALPGGFIAQRQISNMVCLNDNGTPAVGRATVAEDGTYCAITRLDEANFATATDATDVRGEILIEVE
jgi:hypothetical protein